MSLGEYCAAGLPQQGMLPRKTRETVAARRQRVPGRPSARCKRAFGRVIYYLPQRLQCRCANRPTLIHDTGNCARPDLLKRMNREFVSPEMHVRLSRLHPSNPYCLDEGRCRLFNGGSPIIFRSSACIFCRCRKGRDRCGRLWDPCGRVWLLKRLRLLR